MKDDTYVNILIDTLSKKGNILDELINITFKQEDYIKGEELKWDEFEESVGDKDVLITKLNQLDDGFEKIYSHVQKELSENKSSYKEEIIKLQNLIKEVTDKGTKLQIMEIKNKSNVERHFDSNKKTIRNFKVSNQTASNYYKNMADQHQEGQSYFLDKKK